MKNIFEIFDTMSSGRVNQNEILWVFSMGMNGTGKVFFLFHIQEKLNVIFFSSTKVAMVIQAL